MSDNDKAKEASRDAEETTAPPPPYKERGSIMTETDDFQIIEEQDYMPEHAEKQSRHSAAAAETQQGELADLPKRTDSMLKEKGPVYPPRPTKEILTVDEESFPSVGKTSPHQEEQKLLPSAEEEKTALKAHYAEENGAPSSGQQQLAESVKEGNLTRSTHDENTALEAHYSKEEQQEMPPAMPPRPTTSRFSEDLVRGNARPSVPPPMQPSVSLPSNGIPLEYVFAWTRPLLDFPSLHITPTPKIPIPSNNPSVPPTTSWQLLYTCKYQANLHRLTTTQTAPGPEFAGPAPPVEYPFRQIASYKFPEYIIPGVNCGVEVVLEPHEEQLARLGTVSNAVVPAVEQSPRDSKNKDKKQKNKKNRLSSYPPQVHKFMQCTGFLNTKYTMDIPVLDGMQATFKTAPRPRGNTIPPTAATSVPGVPPNPDNANSSPPPQQQPPRPSISTSRPSQLPSGTETTRLITLNDLLTQARNTFSPDSTYTPYQPLQLIVEFDGREVATYHRHAPWARTAGKLVFRQPEIGQVFLTPEFVEGILTATVAMAGMQERMGLANGLLEAVAGAGEGVVSGGSGSGEGRASGGGVGGSVERVTSWGREEWRRLVEEWKRRNQNSANNSGVAPAATHGGANNGGVDWRTWNSYGGPQPQQQQQQYRHQQSQPQQAIGGADDVLAGILTPEEREAALREQLAWDKQARANRHVHFNTAPPASEGQGAAPKWEEKPRVVYA